MIGVVRLNLTIHTLLIHTLLILTFSWTRSGSRRAPAGRGKKEKRQLPIRKVWRGVAEGRRRIPLRRLMMP